MNVVLRSALALYWGVTVERTTSGRYEESTGAQQRVNTCWCSCEDERVQKHAQPVGSGGEQKIMQMQRVPGVKCYCCGEELGSNSQCGKSASSTTLRARPPCLWAHTDPEIVRRCSQKPKIAVRTASGITRFFPIGTAVFVPPQVGGYGLRGVVRSFDAENERYSIEFEGSSNVNKGQIQSGSVDIRKALHYIDQSDKALYPADALPIDSSVRCVIDDKLRRQLSSSKHADAQCICGIIEGAAVDHSNVAIYYNIGPNISVKQFFLAEEVSLVVQVPPPAEATAAVTVDPPTENTEVVVLESSSSSSEFADPQPPVSKALGGVKGKGDGGSKKDEGKAQATFKAPRAPQRARGKGGVAQSKREATAPATFKAVSTTARPPNNSATPDAAAGAVQPAVLKEDHWEESDSEEGAAGAEVLQWNRSAFVYYYGVGQEHAGTVTGRCVNHKTRRASKYIIETPQGSFARVRAQDVYWPSRVPGDSSKAAVPTTTAPQGLASAASKEVAGKGNTTKQLGDAPGAGVQPQRRASEENAGKGNTTKPVVVTPAAGARVPTSTAHSAKGSSSDESSSSSFSSSESEGSVAAQEKSPQRTATRSRKDGNRKRAVKFNYDHEHHETLVIFKQLATNVPWLHSRRSQKSIWKFHLDALQEEGHALELEGHKDALKTFAAWASSICKTRRTARLAEMRRSGTATVEYDAVDDVGYRWEQKVCGDEANTEMNQARAHLLRDVATHTAVSLQQTAAKIDAQRKRRYSAGSKTKKGGDDESTPSKSATPSTNSSPMENAKTALLRQLTELTKQNAEQDAKDAHLVTQIVTTVAAQHVAQPTSHDTSGDLHLLRSFLEKEDSSLVCWAQNIHAALGITEGAHFKELSETDITTAQGIPVMQRKRLLAVAKRYDLGASTH